MAEVLHFRGTPTVSNPTGITEITAANPLPVTGGGGGGGSTTAQGTYNTTAPAPTNGQILSLQLDAGGNLKVAEQNGPQYEDNTRAVAAIALRPLASSTYSYSLYSNASFTSANAKSATGNVTAFSVINSSAGTRYIQFFDTASVPTGGATAVYVFQILAGQQIVIGNDFWGLMGKNFVNGIAIANSTTQNTFTAGTAGDLNIQLFYI